ncbi:hypothetical protein KRR39_05680 [Nocardioides panacis]|uniref:NERD domain-containing protein n=1 Tax=Nocardioides panacis TaxID=2849501 RepID=A0A975Y195_9ACTN|nr:hypothetical protein [Nocardioides panacis]QWZ09275.1 hypothetical protein KRR39_05680 [Nocardioides panacis]
MVGSGPGSALDVLRTLPEGWTVVDDDGTAAGQRVADIPDVVVGPGGIFVVSARTWEGEAAVADRVLTVDGLPRGADTETCLDYALIVAGLAGDYLDAVCPVLCVGADPALLDWAGEVRVCSTTTLHEALAGAPVRLSPDAVAAATALLVNQPEPLDQPVEGPVAGPVVAPAAGPPVPGPRVAEHVVAEPVSPVPRPRPAEPAAEVSRRARLALEQLQASKASEASEASVPSAAAGAPARRRPRRTGRLVRRTVRVLVPLATAAVLVLTGPQLLTSTRSLGQDVWAQLNGDPPPSACAAAGRPAGPAPSADGAARRDGAQHRTTARTKAAARALARKRARTPALADRPTC